MKFIHLTPAALVFVQLGALAVGMASWLDDDEEGSGDSAGDEEFGGDEFDDDFDDEFGSFDDMDGGGGGAGQDASVNELEHRIEELETEVSNVASKANTVRSENEQISESVEDVEENVRKLLEIYEMVTRGVNPFVDDVNADAMGGGGAESFGLFDDDDDGEDTAEEDLDADITDADADDFFEDDAFEEDDEAEDDLDDDGMGEFDDGFDDGDDEMDGFDEFDEDDEAEDDEIADEDESETGGDGTSFEDLKEEYESGDADWAEEDDDEPVAASAESTAPVESDDSDLGFDDSDLEADTEDDEEDGGFEFEEEETSVDEPTSAAPAAPGLGFASNGDEPHLTEPPTGYLADVVALEWLDYLLSEFGPKNTVRTLNYYERIGWIGEPVRDHLFDYLEGLTDSDYLYREEFGTTELTMDDHLESLDYIDELASENIERAIVDRFDDLHRNGIQR
ncbi:FlaD/FlaE family flagellar protein [Halobacterium sp. KA-6]|uniref:FlaD/FlaE family flagellar protein n=1 Tax=Halobacterium sp. KA-6 TaxID=2896368 RepID=UPI001E5B3CF1|nr:FlaD/FlaE family flagellar protein [Halobacterium sp. KA-6]MCD2205000.1 flagella protein [Halobacterium sp. KA-6]